MSEETLLFESGSDRSYISSALTKKIGPKWVSSQPVSYSAFGAGKACGENMRNIFQVGLQGAKCVGGKSALLVVEVPVKCVPLQRPKIPSD